MKKNSIVKYTREYLEVLSHFPHEDIEREFIVISVDNELLLIKDRNDKTDFSKKHLNKYWIYEVTKWKINIKYYMIY